MSRPVTINLNSDIIEKLRIIQAKQTQQNNQHVSFSKIVNQLIMDYFSKA